MQEKRIEKLVRAYDLTVEEYNQNIDPLEKVPAEFKNRPDVKRFLENNKGQSSDSLEIRDYLNPEKGMNFLDVGACANLANYRLDKWPSTYYGVDISPALVNAMRGFVKSHNITVGGLEVAESVQLPFTDNFFDIVAAIGVLEYFDLNYIEQSFKELHRVIKTNGRLVVDIANLNHPDVKIMNQLEEYLGRPKVDVSRADFEQVLKKYFNIDKVNDSVMILYFLRVKN